MTTVLSIIGGLAAIAGSVYGSIKLFVWLMSKTPEQKKETIDTQIVDEQSKVQQTGRPQS